MTEAILATKVVVVLMDEVVLAGQLVTSEAHEVIVTTSVTRTVETWRAADEVTWAVLEGTETASALDAAERTPEGEKPDGCATPDGRAPEG